MNNKVVIKLTNVTKNYVLHHEKPTLMESFITRRKESFSALTNINLEILKGEQVGLIGPNGCGKTTLLKIISGIATPTKGEVLVHGRIISLIDLEAGFHPDMTGIQNIFLNGTVIGMSTSEIRKKLKQIIQFADIDKFIDAPLFTYSEGMKLRLGFSVAINAKPDILIMDENFFVGDTKFRNKIQKEIKELVKKDKTIIMTSHWLEFIKKNCSKVIELNEGRVSKVTTNKKVHTLSL